MEHMPMELKQHGTGETVPDPCVGSRHRRWLESQEGGGWERTLPAEGSDAVVVFRAFSAWECHLQTEDGEASCNFMLQNLYSKCNRQENVDSVMGWSKLAP